MAEMIDCEVRDEGAIFHAAFKSRSGAKCVEARVYGRVTIDGVEYEVDRVLRIALKKTKEREECPTCLGHGRIDDGDTGLPRKCLDCNGTGRAS